MPISFTKGDILDLRQILGYTHYAIFASGEHLDGWPLLKITVIHVMGCSAGERPSTETAAVREEELEFNPSFTMSLVANNYDNHWIAYNPDEIIQRARSKVVELDETYLS